MSPDTIGLGAVSDGGFGPYALQQFTQVAGVRLVAMAGTHRPAAQAAARRFGIPDVKTVDALVARDDVDLVCIATPPFLHHPQTLAGLAASKHVICKKPLAVTVAQADELITAAHRVDRLLVSTLRQRYNPPYDQVAGLIGRGARPGATRLVRQLRLRPEPAGRPLVLGP